jgi:hypothetical protein
MKTLARVALISVGYVALSVLAVQILYQQRPLVELLWVLSIATIIGLVWTALRSQTVKIAGWGRYPIALVAALLTTYFLYMVIMTIGINTLGWEH